MEYADTLYARNISALPDVAFPGEETLESLCNFPTLAETRACFRYFPRIVAYTLEQKGVAEPEAMERVHEICELQKGAMRRITCYAGFGSYGSYFVLTDIPKAVATCEALADSQARASCVLGRLAVATVDRMVPLAAYCEASSEELRTICYQGLFYFLNRVGTSQDSQMSLCSDMSPACMQGYESREANPEPTIEMMEA
jgi:hypothetical protein